jgi:hypothetical protein
MEDDMAKTQTRNGQPLANLPAGDPRRLADGRNAWRKMSPDQRRDFLLWIAQQGLAVAS